MTAGNILDAGPMIAYLSGEAGGSAVGTMLSDPNTVCYAHAVNMAEVYYHFLRNSDETTADMALADLTADGVIVREDMDVAFWKSIAKLKARGRISLADCFCIALAQRLGGQVVTTDHHEFDPIVPMGLVPIGFIR